MAPHRQYALRPFLLSAFRFFLFPLSLIFGSIAALRRKAYQKGWLRSETFEVPTVCVGNLRVGGTGKTPLVEYIAKFLSPNHQIAILSRGYGRKTTGYINARDTQNISSEITGDEPMQYVAKFPNAEVAVCEKRKTGIANLTMKNPKLEMIILDDAYQHLAVNYSLKILLTEYDRPFFKDAPLPSGYLREFRYASKHADIVIVTKCPDHFSNEEKEGFIKKLKPSPCQEVFFTKIEYLRKAESGKQKTKILLITAIDNPKPLLQYFENQSEEVFSLRFPNHHAFTETDIEKIVRLKERLGGENCAILTTEKDATRLQAFENILDFDTLPVEIVFLEKEAVFKEKLLSLLPNKDA